MSKQQENVMEIIEKLASKQKNLLIGVGVLVLLIGAFFYLVKFYLPERELEAQDAMVMAQMNFEEKNYEAALKGDAKNKGFDYMKDNYSFTKANKLAKFYAGICEMNLGKFDLAIADLKGFSSDISELQAVAYSALGDCYAEKNNMSEAVSYYKKAAESTENPTLAPRLTLKAAKALEVNKNYKEAKEMYDLVSDNYPNSQEAQLSGILASKVDNLQ